MVSEKIIKEKVGSWRLEKGNSIVKLAKELGMSRPTLYTRLEGATKWRWDEVLRIAELCNCTLDELSGIEKAG